MICVWLKVLKETEMVCEQQVRRYKCVTLRMRMVLEKMLESPLDSKEIKQSILKETNTEYSLEGLMLKLKLKY